MRCFDRYISIDWAGAGTEDQRVDLRVVEATPDHKAGRVVDPTDTRRGAKAWKRAECREWLALALKGDQPRCLVAMDFGFGYPWRTDEAVFGVAGWQPMLGALSELYEERGKARLVAEQINNLPRFGGHGPYRFNHNRTDARFYLDSGVAYYRLVETAIPQAISQWYLGAGGVVGFHTITGLSALHDLLARRQRGEVDFLVWPQECCTPDNGKHILVESYPALYPAPAGFGDCRDEHCRDAWKALQWMLTTDEAGTLYEAFEIDPVPFGRVEGADFREQVRFEGWILGV